MKTMKMNDTAGCILAIDLGKYKSVARIYPNGQGAEIGYTTLDTTKEERADLLEQVKPSVLLKHRGAEPDSGSAGRSRLADAARRQGLVGDRPERESTSCLRRTAREPSQRGRK